jgi:hypothetical protein
MCSAGGAIRHHRQGSGLAQQLSSLVLRCCATAASFGGIACAGSGRSYAATPSWRVAIILVIFVVISFVVEMSLHWFEHEYVHHKKGELDRMKLAGLVETVHKAKEELMLLGFLSFLLLIFEDAPHCVKATSYNDPFNAMYNAQSSGRMCEGGLDTLNCCSDAPTSRRMLALDSGTATCATFPPCSGSTTAQVLNVTDCCLLEYNRSRRLLGSSSTGGCCAGPQRRRLGLKGYTLGRQQQRRREGNEPGQEQEERVASVPRRRLASVGSACDEGFEEFISINALHQTHLLIFIVAMVHVLYSFFMIQLARNKVPQR